MHTTSTYQDVMPADQGEKHLVRGFFERGVGNRGIRRYSRAVHTYVEPRLAMTETEAPKDPLTALFVDGEELDKEQIVEALSGIAGLSKSGDVVQLAGFSELTARQKVLAYLLAYKASKVLGLRDDDEVSSADLARATGLAEGTVYPTMTELRNGRAVSQGGNSKYSVAHHQVRAATAELSNRSGNGASGTAQRAPRRTAPGNKGRRPKKPAATKQQSDAPKTDAATNPTSKRSSSGSGFKSSEAVAAMIAEGYFDEPKGLGDVRSHLKDVHARDVPVTTLSPLFTRLLRKGELKRKKNAQGNYEYYVAASGS